MTILTFVPAHEDEFLTVKEAVDAWEANKDFRAYPGGFYLNKKNVTNANQLYNEGWLMLPNLKVRLQIW